jgi:hypothetical protein
MHTRIKKHRVKRVNQPLPVAPPVPPRPRRTLLRRIYRNLLSSDRNERVETLIKAMHWYEELLAYLIYQKKWTIAQQRAEVAADKARIKGLRSDKDSVKEEVYLAAIQAYEKMTRSYHAPKIGSYTSKYSRVRSKLEKRRRKYGRKYNDFLELVEKILRPINNEERRIHLHVDKLSSNFKISPEGDVTFNRRFLDTARRATRKYGLLSGMFVLFPALTQAASQTMETDSKHFRTGRYVINYDRRYGILQRFLDQIVDYSLSADNPKPLCIRTTRQSDESTSATRGKR